MKLTFILILFINLEAIANVYSQTKVTINFEATDFKKVLSAIEKQSSYRFVYSERKIPADKKITINANNEEVTSILNQILDKSGFTFNELSNHLVVISPAGKELALTKINGTVLDEKGQPLIGASVRIKGSKSGTQTDINGNFTLEVPENTVLEVSFLGYITQEVAVNGPRVSVQLAVNGNNLNEVVVVGYGTQKKVNLTGAIATVNADKLENRPVVNLADALEGLIPNLNVNLGNGQPGTAASFNVRGTQTLSGSSTVATAPLILIDGVARDPNLIDPNDVESVTVLKDAASSAIYGGRAANGVILITTKSGKKGPVQVSYSGSYTRSKPTKLVQPVNSLQYITMFNYANRTGQLSGGYTTQSFTAKDSTLAAAYFNDPANNSPVYVDAATNPNKYRYVGNTDWSKVLYPGAVPEQQHNVSVSGGEGNTTFNGSMGYFRQNGLEATANQIYQRFTPSLKVNSEVKKWLSLGLNMSLTHTDNNLPATTNINQGGAWLYANIPPLMPVMHPDGNWAGQGNYTNPVAVNTMSGRDIDYRNDFWATGRVTLKPVDHLSVNVDYTWNSFADFDKANLMPFNEYGPNGFLDIYPWTNPAQVTEVKNNNNYNALNAYATYENTFNKKHYFKALVGYNQEYNHYDLVTILAKNLIVPTLPALGLNNDPKPSLSETETKATLIGTFGRLNYIFDNRYLVEVDARYDGSSRFRPNDRYSFSPSASAGWNITEESFMRNLKNTINLLKLRVSYGVLPDQLALGNPSASTQYPYLGLQSSGSVNYVMNGALGTAVGAPNLVGSTLTWEKVQTKNLGMDFAILNEKLSGSFDYFQNDIKDILVKSIQLPAVLGASAPPTNAASVTSHGWELSLNWKDHSADNKLFYSMTLSLSNTSNTKVTKYASNPTNVLSDFIQGQDLGNIYGYVNTGYYKTDAEAQAVNNSALAGYKWLAGDIKYADLNGDGKITPGAGTLTDMGDRKLLGNTTAHYKYGFNFNISYKGLDFTAFIQGVGKRLFYPNDYNFYAFRDDEYSIPSTMTLDYWTPQNPNAFFPRVRFSGGGNEQQQDKYILNAAYARFKQLTLGYTLPASLIHKASLRRVRVYVTGENLFTITSLNSNYDPEITAFGAYPILKSVSFGVQVGL